jgi:hypothetical protein
VISVVVYVMSTPTSALTGSTNIARPDSLSCLRSLKHASEGCMAIISVWLLTNPVAVAASNLSVTSGTVTKTRGVFRCRCLVTTIASSEASWLVDESGGITLGLWGLLASMRSIGSAPLDCL